MLKRNEFSPQDKINKNSPKWEGPYKIVSMDHLTPMYLEDVQNKKLKNTFNVEHPEIFYELSVRHNLVPSNQMNE